MTRNGSAALDMAMVAMGKTDLYVEKGIHAWDIAAGLLLVEEAGVFFCNFLYILFIFLFCESYFI